MEKEINAILSLMERVDHPSIRKPMLIEQVITTKGELAKARKDIDTKPSEAAIMAGNYKKAHITLNGFDITIENPKDSMRSGTDSKGNKWSQKIYGDYGYFLGTKAHDGDSVDVFIKDITPLDFAYVIDQKQDNGDFDESKVIFGATSIDDAKDFYLKNYEKGWDKWSGVSKIDTESFRKWLMSGKTRHKPFNEYSELTDKIIEYKKNN